MSTYTPPLRVSFGTDMNEVEYMSVYNSDGEITGILKDTLCDGRYNPIEELSEKINFLLGRLVELTNLETELAEREARLQERELKFEKKKEKKV